MDRRTIAPGFVADALACLAPRDPAPILAAAGLPPRVTDPITSEAYGRLWQAMADVTEDEFFGLAARPMRPGSFTLLGHAVLHAETLGQALRRAVRFLNVVLDDPRGTVTVQDGQAVILLSDREGPRPAFAYRTYWLILMGLACFLAGRRIPLRRLDFACPAPPQRDDYRQFFGAPVLFDQPKTRLLFDAAFLSLPITRSEAALKTFLRGAPANILVRYRHDQGVAAQLATTLKARACADWPDFETAAADLGFAPATLRRRLKAEGQSFSAIRDRILRQEADRMLGAGRMTVAQVAAELGYSEPGAFHRAYRKWTGQSPGTIRRAAR